MKKIFFGANYANFNGSKAYLDSEVFVVQRVTDAQKCEMDMAKFEKEKLKEKISIPPFLGIIGTLAFMGIPICAKIIQRMLKKQTWDEFMQTTPWMFYIMIGCAAVFVLIWAIAFIRPRIKIQNIDAQRTIERHNRAVDNAYDMLGMPSNSAEVDVFVCTYSMVNGEPFIRTNGEVSFFNAACKAYSDESNLYISDVSIKHAIPLESITCIRRIDERRVMQKWNKDLKCNQGEYKEYKIKMTKENHPEIKYYYALCFGHNGDDFELYFPPYELPVFEQLTRKRALQ